MNPAVAYHAPSQRVLISRPDFRAQNEGEPAPNGASGAWPAAWITCPDCPRSPVIVAFRLHFVATASETLRLHVSADERYALFVDGERAGRGPERGDAAHWFYETYALNLTPGPHVLVAHVWALGSELAPTAQISVGPGFLACPDRPEDAPRLATGVAPWEAKRIDGVTFLSPLAAWGTGARMHVDGVRFPWNFEHGAGEGWLPARAHALARDTAAAPGEREERVLHAATLPPMLEQAVHVGRVRQVSVYAGGETSQTPVSTTLDLPDEAAAWTNLLRLGSRLVLPPRTGRRVIVDWEDYYSGYLAFQTSGGTGASIRVHWQEALFDDPLAKSKGDRNAVAGKYFTTIWHLRDGVGNSYGCDGGAHRKFEPLWWEAGRYVEILVQTAEEPLTLEAIELRETRYPLDVTAQFTCSDAKLNAVWPVMRRTLELCSHETYLDCPFYEQLMYTGDSRIEALLTYVLSRDTRLPRKALDAFAWSQLPSGITLSRYPCAVRQIIPPFSLLWIGMLHDHALWRGDADHIRQHVSAIQGVLDYFARFTTSTGLLLSPPGWNFVDWVPAWPHGVPPGGMGGVSCILNFLYLGALRQAADLLAWTGDRAEALRRGNEARTLGQAVHDSFWSPERQLFADDLRHDHFSEHTQSLAVLALLDAPDNPFAAAPATLPGLEGEAVRAAVAAAGNALLAGDPGLVPTTIYFSHYRFEALERLGGPVADRFAEWSALPELGFKTTREGPEPSRSDCHAWSAHPLIHCATGILGIRPGTPGFATVIVRPRLGSLTFARGTIPHPAGLITARFEREGAQLRGMVTLPPGTRGTLHLDNRSMPLEPGDNPVE